jgi:DeoR/GlpR family transcriptional regulator of sugar metabolism
MLHAAQEAILVADHTKFGRVAPALLVPIESIQTLITDTATYRETMEGIQDLGIHVILA